MLWRKASASLWRCALHERGCASCPFSSAAAARCHLRSPPAASCQRPSSAHPTPAGPACVPGRRLACGTCRSGNLCQSAQAFSWSSFELEKTHLVKKRTQSGGHYYCGNIEPIQKRITGLWQPSVHSDVAFLLFDVGSSIHCVAQKSSSIR